MANYCSQEGQMLGAARWYGCAEVFEDLEVCGPRKPERDTGPSVDEGCKVGREICAV